MSNGSLRIGNGQLVLVIASCRGTDFDQVKGMPPESGAGAGYIDHECLIVCFRPS